MEKVIYIEDYEAFKSQEIDFEHTPFIVKDNKALFVTLEDLSSLSSVEVLGSYDYVFANESLNSKYLSVHNYNEVITLEDGTTYQKPKKIGTFGTTTDLNEYKAKQINQIKKDCTALNPVTMEVDLYDGTKKEITFNGGEYSAQAIEGATKLADTLSEDRAIIWDIIDEMHEMEIIEALEVSTNIAKIYRDKMYKRQNLITQINKANSVEEVEGITWIED